jgi:AraC-like DNA-binding protein
MPGSPKSEYSFTLVDNARAHWTLPEIYAPPRDLRRYLDACFITQGMFAQNPRERGRRMPEGASYIVFLHGRVTSSGVRDEAILIAGGAHDRIFDIPTWSYVYQCGLRIQPGAASAVLGSAASAIKNLIVPLRELWREDAAVLLDRLLATGSSRDRLGLLCQAVRNRLAGAQNTDQAAVHLAEAIRGARGDTRLSRIAQDCGTSVRTLERRFGANIGMGPKQYQRLARIARVFELVGGSSRTWADVAAECGYYDQSHLVDDCHQILGHPPEQFLDRLTNVASLTIGLIFEKEASAHIAGDWRTA